MALAAGLSCTSDGGPHSGGHHTTINGVVWWSGPVSGARVECWQRLPDGELYGTAPVATATTDARGAFTLDIGEQGNVVELRAYGGSFVDAASGTTLTLDASVELRSAQQNVQLDETRQGAVVSPLTELMVALAEQRRAIGKPDSIDYEDSLDRARALLGTHAMDLDLTGVVPADVTSSAAQPATSPTDEYRYGVLLAGMSTYADPCLQDEIDDLKSQVEYDERVTDE